MEIIVTNRKGEVFTVQYDVEDYQLVNKYKWCICKNKGNLYAKTNVRINGQQKTLILHRLILSVNDKTVIIDHKNHNGLDNRRFNLRICDNKSNTRNTSSTKGSTSKYLGVSFNTARKKWVSVITVDGKVNFLGYFMVERAAAHAYDIAAEKYFGEFANRNLG